MALSNHKRGPRPSGAQIVAVFAALNAVAAVAVFLWGGIAGGISQAAMMGRWTTLEHARVVILDPVPLVEGVQDTSKWGMFDYLTSGIVDALHSTRWVACIIPAANAIALGIVAVQLRRIARQTDHEPLERPGGSNAESRW